MFAKLGYNNKLFILPFDHRGSFEKEFPKETISDLKQIIYEAFKKSLESVPKRDSAILIDEQYGDIILKDAKQQDLTTILTTEKSGQEGFEFEYGENFGAHIEKYQPDFAKALIRYKPDTNWSKLQMLSDYCHNNNYKFLLEVLLNAPTQTSQKALRAIDELHKAGIEPDVWKLEGMESESAYREVVTKIQENERINVGLVILGRGENEETVKKWITDGAKVKGVIGFAVGRTIFLEPLKMLRDGKITKEDVINKIANNFRYFCDVFMKGK